MTIDLLTEMPITSFPVPTDTPYNEYAVLTAAHAIAGLIQVPDQALVHKVAGALHPWVPVHPKEGKMTKRIASYLFAEHNVKADSGMLSHVGNYLASDTPSDSITLSIVKDLTHWKMGEFGDTKSCFANQLTTLFSMQKAGGTGLRLYNGEGKGAGRTWVLPFRDHPVLINAYGPTLEGFRARLRILMPDMGFHLVTTRNEGTDTGSLWINLGVGLWVGGHGETPPEEVDFNIHCNARPPITCCNCDREYNSSTGFRRDKHGGLVCRSCKDLYYELDRMHGRLWHRDELVPVQMALSDHGRWSRAIGYLREEDIPYVMKCAKCEFPVENSYTLHCTVDEKEYELCQVCLDENWADWPYVCRSCGRYAREFKETCCCGGKAKYKR